LSEIIFYSGNLGTWYVDDLSDSSAVVPLTTTQFVTYDPTLGTTTPIATSTSFSFGVTGYLDSTDLASSTEIYMRFRQQTGMGIRGNPVTSRYGEFTFPLTASGEFDVSTSTPILNTGVYAAYWEIRNCSFSLFGVCFWHDTLVSSIGNFVVGEATEQEIGSTEALLDTNLGNITGVGNTQFITSSTTTTFFDPGFIGSLKNSVMSKVPFVWVTQVVGAFNSISYGTTTMPTLALTASTTSFQLILGGDNELTLLSQAEFEQYIPSPVHNTFMVLQGLVFYLAGGMYMFRRTTRFFQPQQ